MTAQIIPFRFKKKKPELHCAFCKRPASQVKKLICGMNNVAICDECTHIAVAQIKENAK